MANAHRAVYLARGGCRDCGEPRAPHSKQLCQRHLDIHLSRWRAKRNLGRKEWLIAQADKSIARLFRKIVKGECWEWLGHLGTGGYGRARVPGRLNYKALEYVHRIVYELLVGPIPVGMELDHLCMNRRCCKPEHLEIVTRAENMRRATEMRHGRLAG